MFFRGMSAVWLYQLSGRINVVITQHKPIFIQKPCRGLFIWQNPTITGFDIDRILPEFKSTLPSVARWSLWCYVNASGKPLGFPNLSMTAKMKLNGGWLKSHSGGLSQYLLWGSRSGAKTT